MPFSTIALSTSPTAFVASLVASGVVGAGACRAVLRKQFSGRPTPNHRKVHRSAVSGKLAGQVTWDALLASSVSSPSKGDEVALARANAFIDRLAGLPLSEWLAIGRTVLYDGEANSTRWTSSAIVDATIDHWGLSVAAWHVLDGVETIAFLARGSGVARSRTDRRMFVAARRAAEDAALALLVYPCLPTQDFQALTAPFVARELGAALAP